MIEVRGDNEFFDVITTTEWDANANNFSGANKVVVQVTPGYKFTQLTEDFNKMKEEFDLLKLELENEKALRDTNPGLKELYDQYKVVYKLVKKTDDALKDVN